MAFLQQSYSKNVRFLKAKATKQSIIGVIIACIAIITATIASSILDSGSVSLKGVVDAQKNNFVLWILDTMPFVFAVWGQYVGSLIAYEASALVMDQTQDLRTQTAALEIKAEHDMTHDSLTGLPNRVLLQDRVEQSISTAFREKFKIALMVLDIDRFKEINETLGHFNGDRILKQFVVRLNGVIRDSDTLARLGGDDFVILIRKISSKKDVEKVAKNIQNALDPPFATEGLTLDIQVSIGAALCPDHGQDFDTLLQHADMSMYAAKNDKSGFVIFSDKLNKSSPQKLTLMGELKQAIERDELRIFFQPKVDNKGEQVTDIEALVRWQHPKHGLMAPNEFIPLAERTGLIKDLSLWVLKNSLSQLSQWRNDGYEFGLSVNISAQDLLDPELADTVAGLLAQFNIPADKLCLEITETSVLADPERALEILHHISDIGVRISIDDFGTGYSSLAHLRKMPVNEIKIDRSFVIDMLENHNDKIIVQATIGLGKNLGLDVVAEGVENSETMAELHELGCNQLQGFLFNKPRNAEDFIEWFKKHRIEVEKKD